MSWCSECAAHHRPGTEHFPQWEVWRTEAGYGETRDEASVYRACDAEDAAERWAYDDDGRGDYRIVAGNDAEVCVSRVGSNVVVRYTVRGEAVREYTADRIDSEEDEEEAESSDV